MHHFLIPVLVSCSSQHLIYSCFIHTRSLGRRDPDGQPRLSPEQLRVAPIWRRPRCDRQFQDIYSSQAFEAPSVESIMIQQTVTDCSVCASISVCIEHTRRFGSHVRMLEIRVCNN